MNVVTYISPITLVKFNSLYVHTLPGHKIHTTAWDCNHEAKHLTTQTLPYCMVAILRQRSLNSTYAFHWGRICRQTCYVQYDLFNRSQELFQKYMCKIQKQGLKAFQNLKRKILPSLFEKSPPCIEESTMMSAT